MKFNVSALVSAAVAVGLLCVAWAVPCHAASSPSYRSLVVRQTDGKQLAVALSTALAITFTDEALCLTDGELNVEIPRTLVADIDFSEEEASVDAAIAPSAAAEPRLSNCGLLFDASLADDAQIIVYSTTGTLLKRQIAAESRWLPFDCLPKGVAIVCVGGNVYKILVK